MTGTGAALADIFVDPVMNDCPQEIGQHTAASCIELDFSGGGSAVEVFPFPFDSQGVFTYAGAMGTLTITPSLGPEPEGLVLLSTGLIALAGIKKSKRGGMMTPHHRRGPWSVRTTGYPEATLDAQEDRLAMRAEG